MRRLRLRPDVDDDASSLCGMRVEIAGHQIKPGGHRLLWTMRAGSNAPEPRRRLCLTYTIAIICLLASDRI